MPCETCKRCYTCGRSPDQASRLAGGTAYLTGSMTVDGEDVPIEFSEAPCVECGQITYSANTGVGSP